MIASGQKSNQRGEYFSSIENILKPCEWEEGINTLKISTFLSPMKQMLYNEKSGYYFILGGENLYYSLDKKKWLVLTRVKKAIDSCIDNKGTVYLLAQNKIFVNTSIDSAPLFLTTYSTDSYYSLATNGDMVIAGGLREIYYLENGIFQKSLSGLSESNNSFRVWFKGGKFFATDGNSDKRQPLYVSSDGKNWIQAQSGNKFCNYYTKVEYFNNFWYSNFGSYLYKSSDGENWETTRFNNVRDFLGGENNFFILDSGGGIYNLNNRVTTLPDFSTVHGDHYGIEIFNNNNFWSVWAADSTLGNIDMVYSNDNGKNWQTVSLPDCGSLIKIDEQYCTFGYNTRKIFFTINLKNWREYQFAVSLSNITTGQNSAIGVYSNEIYYTSDGITWAKSSQPLFSNSNEKYYMNLSYAQGTFFICTNYNNSYNWYYSTDAGVSWNKANTSNYPGLVNTDLTNMSAVILREYDNVVFAFDANFTNFEYQYLDLTLTNSWNGIALSCNSKAYVNMKNGFYAWGETNGGISIERNSTRMYLEAFSMLYGSDYSFIQLFYVNQRLYAVNSDYNLIYFNDDLTWWQEASINLYSQTIDFISYGNGLYILRNNSGQIYTSIAGTSFSLNSSLSDKEFYYIFYTGEFWIGMTIDSLYYSKEGDQWIKFHSGPGRLSSSNLGNFIPKNKSFALFNDGVNLYYYTIPIQIS